MKKSHLGLQLDLGSLFFTQSHTPKAGLVLTYSASSMATGHLYWAVLKRQMSAYWRTGEEVGKKVV